MGIINRVKRILKGSKPPVYVNVNSVENDSLLKNRKILITGGSSGIGYEIAKTCLYHGADVLITGKNKQKLENAALSLADETQNLKNNVRINYLTWDICDFNIIESRLNTAIEILGGWTAWLIMQEYIRDLRISRIVRLRLWTSY